MASLEDVARLANVSPITVSRVVRGEGYVRPETRERVLAAIAQLNYIPNAVARGLRQSRSGMIAFLVHDISSPFYTAVAHGATEAARAAGLSLLFGNTSSEPELEAEYLRAMVERRVDAVVFAPTSAASLDLLAHSVPAETPVVCFDRAFPGTRADVVRSDTRRGVIALCHHLLGLGHRRIAIVGGTPGVATWQERVEGYRDALREAGLPEAPALIIPGNYKRAGGAEAVRALLDQGGLPDAIIAANSQVTLGLLDELTERGIRVPDDVGVAAVDDPLPKSRFWPRLTVVEQPGYAMGKRAIELVADRLQHPRSERPPQEIVFEAELVVGTSCGEGRADSVTSPPVTAELSLESRAP